MNEIDKLIDLLKRKEKLAAMLAPSFPIVYNYPQIAGKLKRLGFTYVVEVSAGAAKTNERILRILQTNSDKRVITGPCPSITRLIKNKYPHLLKYLVLNVDSPMAATARIVKEKWPDCLSVFIGPCIAKKLESSENYPELNILVLTFKELDEVFKNFNIQDDSNNAAKFDINFQQTRIYPLAGGLLETSGVKNILGSDQVQQVSGWENCAEALRDFEKNTNIRLLDILFCEGGCINGPGISSSLTPEERKNKIKEFANLNV